MEEALLVMTLVMASGGKAPTGHPPIVETRRESPPPPLYVREVKKKAQCFCTEKCECGCQQDGICRCKITYNEVKTDPVSVPNTMQMPTQLPNYQIEQPLHVRIPTYAEQVSPMYQPQFFQQSFQPTFQSAPSSRNC